MLSKATVGYLYADIAAHNPSVPAINRAILTSARFRVHGLDVTRASLSDARKLIRDTNVLVVESSCLLGRNDAAGEPKYRRFRRDTDTRTVSAIIDMVWGSTATLFLLEGNYDIHAPLGFGLTQMEMERIDYLIWPYTAEPVGYFSGIRPTRYVEPWMQDKLDPVKNWQGISKRVPRQIEYHHSLDATDFGSPGSLKFWDAAIPGARYVTRDIASASARSQDLTLAPYHAVDRSLRMGTTSISALGGRVGDSIRFNLRRLNMRHLMRHSRSVYVCGGGPEYFVRKFLEVPALGLPMFGFPVEALPRLGFNAEEHFVPTLPEDFGECLQKKLAGPRLQMTAMAQRSQMLVKRLHTSTIRAQNLLELVSVAKDDAFRKAVFVRGSVVPID